MKHFRTFNFVNSVKGGSGKTTFAIFLNRYLTFMKEDGSLLKYAKIGNLGNLSDTELVNKIEENSKKTVVFDMDFQGTAMQYLFYGGNKNDNLSYLNDAVGKTKDWEKYITKCDFQDQRTAMVLCADGSVATKKKYRVTAQAGYSPAIRYNMFRGAFCEFLKNFEESNYEHLIFDMPPNSDGFSDSAMECVLNQRYSVLRQDDNAQSDKVNLFYMTGIDYGHAITTLDEIEDFLLGQNNKEFDNIFVVFNTQLLEEGGAWGSGEERKKKILPICTLHMEEYKKRLEGKLSEQDYKKINFLIMDVIAPYRDYCVLGKGLCNAPDDIFPLLFLSYKANIMDVEFKKIEEIDYDWLYKRMIKAE